jgi:phosphoribosyl 1,2-cyclic phosphodiesterase
VNLRYYGARGSLPTPGPATVKYGGNTTCLFFESGTQRYIVDAGSGLRLLGLDLVKQGFGKGQGQATFFWTHFHWDHLMGFPFFVPNFIKGNRFTHFGSSRVRELLVRQQDFVTFPVEFDKMPAEHVFQTVEIGQTFTAGALNVTSCRMNHPAGGFTFRFSDGKRSFVFATDVEHKPNGPDPELLKLCTGTDLLIYDAQYTPDEYAAGKLGWGHSTWLAAVELAKAAGVKRLHLCHHDQLHSDRFLETKILAPAKKLFPHTALAREGWHFEL